MTFDELADIATTVVELTQRRLPAAIREAALSVPVSFEPFPARNWSPTAWIPIFWAFFWVRTITAAPGETEVLPSQIVLFLENLWDFSEADKAVYQAEVRLTYFHELGHYFGWNEAEIEQRGLE